MRDADATNILALWSRNLVTTRFLFVQKLNAVERSMRRET